MLSTWPVRMKPRSARKVLEGPGLNCHLEIDEGGEGRRGGESTGTGLPLGFRWLLFGIAQLSAFLTFG